MAIPIFDACTFFGPWPQHAADLSTETLLAVMTRNGIVRSLTTATTGIFYDYRQGNIETLEVARQNPQQLFPVATLDPRAFPEAVEEAKARAADGFRLFRFFPGRQNWPLAFAPFRELLQTCDELRVPVAVNVTRPGDITALADEVAFTQAPLLLSGVTPYLLGEALAAMRNHPKFYLETTALLAPNSLETVKAAVPHGIERLVFASHSPLRYVASSLGTVMTANLNEDEKALILGGNLRRLLTK